MRDTHRERQRHRQREKQAPRREPDMGLNPPGLQDHPLAEGSAKLLSHPGCPMHFELDASVSITST